MSQFEYQIFPAECKSKTIYELARKNPKPIYKVETTDFRLSQWGIICRVHFSNDYDNLNTFTVIVKDKKRLAKKIENVVKSYCNIFGYAYAKTSSIHSARNKLAKEPVKSVPTDKKEPVQSVPTDKKELWHKIEKMEREIRELKKKLSK